MVSCESRGRGVDVYDYFMKFVTIGRRAWRAIEAFRVNFVKQSVLAIYYLLYDHVYFDAEMQVQVHKNLPKFINKISIFMYPVLPLDTKFYP